MTSWNGIPRGLAHGALLVLTAFTAVSAVGGGIGLLTPGSMGIPLSLLDGSPFPDYVDPALILGLLIGGTQAVAFATQLRRMRTAALWNAIAAFALVIFIFVELAIVRGFSPLHGIYFATGLAELALVLALLGVVPGLLRAPREASRASAGAGTTR